MTEALSTLTPLAFNSSTKFSIYGGAGAYSNKDARGVNPTGNFKSGTQLATKTFSSNDVTFDNSWFTFGPFNPQDGEVDKTLNATIFKIVVEGLDGDDGGCTSSLLLSSFSSFAKLTLDTTISKLPFLPALILNVCS